MSIARRADQGTAPVRPSVVGRPPRGRRLLVEPGGMVLLLVAAVRAGVRHPAKWWPTARDEAWTLVSRCLFPLSISMFAFGFGAIGVQSGTVLDAFGSSDRAGGVFVTATVREVGAWVTAMVVAGVAGTAICADLGARKMRDELAAMNVMGVDAMVALVVPRMVALTLITPLLFLVACAFSMLSGVAAVFLIYDTTLPAFTASFQANFNPVELFGAFLKTMIFGAIIAVICCYKGLNCSGGAEGVGRAVNQAVVASFAALWVFNYAFTSVLLASFPELQGLR